MRIGNIRPDTDKNLECFKERFAAIAELDGHGKTISEQDWRLLYGQVARDNAVVDNRPVYDYVEGTGGTTFVGSGNAPLKTISLKRKPEEKVVLSIPSFSETEDFRTIYGLFFNQRDLDFITTDGIITETAFVSLYHALRNKLQKNSSEKPKELNPQKESLERADDDSGMTCAQASALFSGEAAQVLSKQWDIPNQRTNLKNKAKTENGAYLAVVSPSLNFNYNSLYMAFANLYSENNTSAMNDAIIDKFSAQAMNDWKTNVRDSFSTIPRGLNLMDTKDDLKDSKLVLIDRDEWTAAKVTYQNQQGGIDGPAFLDFATYYDLTDDIVEKYKKTGITAREYAELFDRFATIVPAADRKGVTAYGLFHMNCKVYFKIPDGIDPETGKPKFMRKVSTFSNLDALFKSPRTFVIEENWDGKNPFIMPLGYESNSGPQSWPP